MRALFLFVVLLVTVLCLCACGAVAAVDPEPTSQYQGSCQSGYYQLAPESECYRLAATAVPVPGKISGGVDVLGEITVNIPPLSFVAGVLTLLVIIGLMTWYALGPRNRPYN